MVQLGEQVHFSESRCLLLGPRGDKLCSIFCFSYLLGHTFNIGKCASGEKKKQQSQSQSRIVQNLSLIVGLRYEDIQKNTASYCQFDKNWFQCRQCFSSCTLHKIMGFQMWPKKLCLPSNFLMNVIIVCQPTHFPQNSLLIFHGVLFTFSYSNEKALIRSNKLCSPLQTTAKPPAYSCQFPDFNQASYHSDRLTSYLHEW